MLSPENTTVQRVSFLDMFKSLSTALDLVNSQMGDHHKLTCYIASHIGRELGLSSDDYETLFGASLIHDLGASSLADRINLLEFEVENGNDHAVMGENILESVAPLANFAPHVGDHHKPWRNGRGRGQRQRELSVISQIIQVADRASVLIDRNAPLPLQSNAIRDKISLGAGEKFKPEITTVFADIAYNHEFWLKMDGAFLDTSVTDLSTFQDRLLSLRELENLARVYAFIIDSRSRFTASHSSGVAVVAENLARAHGLSAEESLKLKIAGYLHDIGKLSVPGEILEKKTQLSDEERMVMKGHSFYTQKIIAEVKGLQEIGTWAAQHHEFLDGSGYPFGLKAPDLDVASRILTVADIFTALTEDRPYRDGMDLPSAMGLLENFVQRGQIDESIFNTLIDNVAAIDEVRARAQELENHMLEGFWERIEHHLTAEPDVVDEAT